LEKFFAPSSRLIEALREGDVDCKRPGFVEDTVCEAEFYAIGWLEELGVE
jgi:hypothetical protein